jgi:hypothetical protein
LTDLLLRNCSDKENVQVDPLATAVNKLGSLVGKQETVADVLDPNDCSITF